MTEKRFRFTQKSLEVLAAPAAGVAVFYDTEVKQLGLRVQPSGHKSYFVLKQVAGRPERKTLGTVGELKLDAARTVAQNLVAQLSEWKARGATGLSPLAKPERGLTFDDVLEAYFKSFHAPRSKPVKDPAATEERCRYMAEKYLTKLKPLAIEQVTSARIETLHRSIADEHGPVTANRAVELACAAWRNAVRRKLTEIPDPTAAVARFAEQKRTRFLQPDELVRLHAALQAEPNADARDFVMLLLATGVRRGNLYSAQFSEISFPLQTWTIPALKSKNGREMVIQLTPVALAVFERRRKELPDSDFVFPSGISESGHIECYKAQWRRIRKAAEIPDVSFHDIRRTTGSYQAIAGSSLATIGASLGHSSIASTMIYARLHQSAVRQSLLAGEEAQAKLMDAARKQLKASAATA